MNTCLSVHAFYQEYKLISTNHSSTRNDRVIPCVHVFMDKCTKERALRITEDEFPRQQVWAEETKKLLPHLQMGGLVPRGTVITWVKWDNARDAVWWAASPDGS